MARKQVLIIGNSAAGLAAIEAFRKRDQEAAITLVDAEDCLAYSRVLTTYFLAGLVSEEGLFLRGWNDYRNAGVQTLMGRRAVALDTNRQRVTLDDGRKLPFDVLLLATGSSAVLPNVEGVDQPGVFTLRSLEDGRRIRTRAESAKEVVVLGAGLVSLETLDALYGHGRRFRLIVSSDRVLSQTLDREAAMLLEKVLREREVEVLKEKTARRITASGGKRLTVDLDSGERLRADMVFIGKGVRPNTDFLSSSSVQVSQGVIVDARMQTSVEGVFAAGDVAQPRDRIADGGRIHGVWPEAVDEGKVAGTNMAGEKLLHTGALRLNVTRILGQVIAVAGEIDTPRAAKTVEYRDPVRRIYRKISFDKKGRILGAVLFNSCSDVGILRGLIRSGRTVDFLAKTIARTPVHYGSLSTAGRL